MEKSTMQDYRVKSSRKLYEQVLQRIHEMIVQGIYQKGDLLPSEKELMDMMGVSRITVRGALRQLNASGVIETRQGKGSFVRIASDELQQYFENGENYRTSFLHATDARLLLEPSIAAALAKQNTAENLAILRESLQEGRSPAAFHAALIRAINNPVVSGWFAETSELEADPIMGRMILPAKQKHTAEMLALHHRSIFEAIQDGKEAEAYARMKEHLIYVRSIYETYFNTISC